MSRSQVTCDQAEIERALTLLCRAGNVYELRALGSSKGTQRGYFKDFAKMARAAAGLSGHAEGVYFTLNSVDPELLARADNQVKSYVKQGEATKDEDIVQQLRFGIDFDAVRKAGISSTDYEHRAATDRAYECRDRLRSRGWPDPLVGDSDNGGHLVYGIDLFNDADSRMLLKQSLSGLASKFSDDKVRVDQTTFNASRLWKTYGTMVCKGASMPDRPHRIAGILEAPQRLDAVPVEFLQRLADMAPSTENRTRPSSNGSKPRTSNGMGDYATLDVVFWFQAHRHYGGVLGDGKHAVQCPWVNEHTDQRPAEDSDTVVWEASDGHWPRFHCSHDHCVGRNLKDVLALWGDPDDFCSRPFAGGAGKSSNLTSDYITPSSEVRLDRVNAGDLQERALGGDIPELTSLPFLSQSDRSPILEGMPHLLSAYPKTGKTELLTRLVAEWNHAGLKVAYFTEEPERIWAARLSRLPRSFQNVELICALGAGAEAILRAMADGDDVVVLDTTRLLLFPDENDNAAVNRALTPFVALCRQTGATFIAAHHSRKGSGEHGEAAAGAHAFLGLVDVGLELHRDKNVSRRRLLRGWGRVVEVPELVYELDENGAMKCLGDPHAVEFRAVKDSAWEHLTTDWQTTKQIRGALPEPKPSIDQLTAVLRALVIEGLVDRDPPMAEGSRRGKTYRWRVGNLTSDDRSLYVGGEVAEEEDDQPHPAGGAEMAGVLTPVVSTDVPAMGWEADL